MVIETLYKVMARRLNQHSGGMGKSGRSKIWEALSGSS